MRIHRLILIVSLSVFFLVSGCGGGGGRALNGSLTIAPIETDKTTFSQFDFTIAYTNPTVSNLLGVEINVVTSSPGIPGAASSGTFVTNNSGAFVLSFILPRDPNNDQFFIITATTGNLVASKAVIVPKQGTIPPVTTPMSALPSTLTFTASAPIDSTQTSIISGGTGSYSVLNINPSPNTNIDATIVGSTLTVKKLSLVTAGIATILIIDTASPPNSTTVTVNY